jgi:hypothetical protein
MILKERDHLQDIGIDKKGKNAHVTGRANLWGCEPSRLPHFLDNGSHMAMRLSALRASRPPFTPTNIPGTHFC